MSAQPPPVEPAHRAQFDARMAEAGLIAVFFACIFEGAARKWLLPATPVELGYAAYMSKFLLFAAMCLLTRPARALTTTRGYGAGLAIGISLLIAGATISASNGFSPSGTVLTTTMAMLAPVLAYFAAKRLLLADLTRVARYVVVFSFFPAALGLVQFDLPAGHDLNRYVGGSDPSSVIVSLGRVRATGTFSFISGMSAMTLAGVWAGLFLRSQASSSLNRHLGLAGVIAALTCGLAALSRGGLFFATIIILGRLAIGGRDRVLMVLALVSIAGLATTLAEVDRRSPDQTTLTTGVFARHQAGDSVAHRAGGFLSQLGMAVEESPFGAGLGTGQVGASVVETGRYRLRAHEGELGRLVVEVGVLGLLGALIIRLTLLGLLLSAALKLPAGRERTTVVICGLGVGVLLVGNVSFNHVISGFVWPMVAIALAYTNRCLYLHRLRGRGA